MCSKSSWLNYTFKFGVRYYFVRDHGSCRSHTSLTGILFITLNRPSTFRRGRFQAKQSFFPTLLRCVTEGRQDNKMKKGILTPYQGRKGDRKLLIGEFVEVRQKEKGLRGSWHPGVVVKVWLGRRSVEYDELLSKDGIQKLREHIPVPKGVEGSLLSSQHMSRFPAQKERGFIRPRPPHCAEVPKENWKKGLWVDAFYEDAWWEGILMEDVLETTDETQVRVFFPDEGDQGQTFLKELRVFQEWDDENNLWSIKGYTLPGERVDDATTCGTHEAVERNKFGIMNTHNVVEIKMLEILDTHKEIVERKEVGNLEIDKEAGEKTESGVSAKTRPTLISQVCAGQGKNQDVSMHTLSSCFQTGCCNMWSHSSDFHGMTDTTGMIDYKDKADRFSMQNCSGDFYGVMDETAMIVDNEKRTDRLSMLVLGSASQGVMDATGMNDCKEDQTDRSSMWSHSSGFQGAMNTIGMTDDKEDQADHSFMPSSRCDFLEAMDAAGMIDGKENHIYRSSIPSLINGFQGVTDATGTIGDKEIQNNCSSMPSASGGFQGVTNVTHPIIDKKNQSDCFSMPKINPTSWLDSYGYEYSGKEETLAEWITMTKRQVLEGQMFGKHKSTDDVIKEHVNMNQCNTIKSAADAGKVAKKSEKCVKGLDTVAENKKHLVSNASKNKIFYSRKGKAREYCLTNNCNKYSTAAMHDVIQEVLDRAKKTLQEAGWKIFYKLQNGNKKVSCYLSPEGGRYYSLSAACTEWRRFHGSGIDVKSLQESGVLEIFNAYILSKGMKWTEEPFNGQKKVLKATSTSSKSPRSSNKQNGNSEIVIYWPSQNRRYSPLSETCAQREKTQPTTLQTKSCGHHIKSSSNCKHSRVQRLSVTETSLRKRNYNVSKGTTNRVKVKQQRHTSEVTEQILSSKKSHARSSCRLEVLSSSGRGGADADTVFSTSKRTIISWLIDMGVIAENERVSYLCSKDKRMMMEGQVTRDGILCKCCKIIWTLSDFETHAGSNLYRGCADIFVADGRSLSECQMQALKIKDAGKLHRKAGSQSKQGDVEFSDDTCGVCGDGGKLICCDQCPSTFHLDCVQVENVPKGDWYCPYCRCAVCGDSRFSDGEPFNKLSLLCCHQCGREYHIACSYAGGKPNMDRCLENKWFCGDSCEKIFKELQRLVGTTNVLEDGYSWKLLRSTEEDEGPMSTTEYSLEVLAEHNSKIAIALSVMQECFRPMIDTRTTIEMISHILYNRGSEMNRLNFRGFYTLILEKRDELISVASIRVHGAWLAEMPLIGTQFQYRRQGMCRRLMAELEKMLQKLQVEMLVLPAVPDLLETWTTAFGFEPMSLSERLKLVNFSIAAFPGTKLMQKSLTNFRSSTVELRSTCRNSFDVPGTVLPADYDSNEVEKQAKESSQEK